MNEPPARRNRPGTGGSQRTTQHSTHGHGTARIDHTGVIYDVVRAVVRELRNGGDHDDVLKAAEAVRAHLADELNYAVFVGVEVALDHLKFTRRVA